MFKPAITVFLATRGQWKQAVVQLSSFVSCVSGHLMKFNIHSSHSSALGVYLSEISASLAAKCCAMFTSQL